MTPSVGTEVITLIKTSSELTFKPFEDFLILLYIFCGLNETSSPSRFYIFNDIVLLI